MGPFSQDLRNEDQDGVLTASARHNLKHIRQLSLDIRFSEFLKATWYGEQIAMPRGNPARPYMRTAKKMSVPCTYLKIS